MGPFKTGFLALSALAVTACQEEAGYQADFPPVGGQAPIVLPEAGPPVGLIPTEEEVSNEALTESLSAAVNEALEVTPQGTVTPVEAPATGSGIASDSGVLNLALQTQEEQRQLRDADAAALAEAAANRVVIQPGEMPAVIANVNIITYARETTNSVGERQFRRPMIRRLNSASQCAKFDSADNAQRNFLANGGPQDDPLNLDPDGDGFACRWSPEAYRALVLN